jgi:pSer/pThr/pTyr-binding forkhead associated (FHA) protein/tetratricopeptide (TPR) repeat protein
VTIEGVWFLTMDREDSKSDEEITGESEATNEKETSDEGIEEEPTGKMEIPPLSWPRDDVAQKTNRGSEHREETQEDTLDGEIPDSKGTIVDRLPDPESASQAKTKIINQKDEQPLPVAYFVVLRGEEEDREIELSKEKLTIGRGADNDLVFPDIACSRHHAMVECVDGQYFLSDLGSGNGTLINGRKVQRTALRDSDEVEFGNTLLQFNYPGAEEEDRGSPSYQKSSSLTRQRLMPTHVADEWKGAWVTWMADPQRRRLTTFAMGVVALILLMMALKLMLSLGKQTTSEEKIDVDRKAAQEEKEVMNRMQTIRELVKEKKWREAGLEIQLVLRIDPENKDAVMYHKAIQKEGAAFLALQTAQSYMDQKAWDNASKSLEAIPEDSEISEEAKKMKEQVLQMKIEGLVREGQELMKSKNFQQALVILDQVIRIKPNHEEAVLLVREAKEEIEKEKKRQAVLEDRAVKAEKRVVPDVRKTPTAGVQGQVLALYRNKEIDRAISKAEASGAKSLALKLRTFSNRYEKGKDLEQQGGQLAEAYKVLTEAYAYDREISKGTGKYHDELASMLARTCVRRGVESQNQKNYSEANKFFNTALKYDPDLDLAKQKLAALEKTAKSFFETAYVIMSSDSVKALSLLNIVLQILPPGHEYYGKAKKLKASIEGAGSNNESQTEP